MTKQSLKKIAYVVPAFLVGVLSVIALRIATIKDTHTHYHANFALFISGQRDQFKNFTFYEEVNGCGGNDLDNPKIRVHMHDNANANVHVHDHAVTWGAFFANLGYTLGDGLIKTDDGLYRDGQDGKKLTFWLNGKQVQTAANRVIQDKDVMLISYGDESQATLQKQYDQIPRTAEELDSHADPAACSGTKHLTFWEKVKQSVWTVNSEH